ncbi:alpha-2,8-polysialyltransferase family protein [Neisseria meningitidis]|nr:alpha-2,8-polysialyltransferase family protein [Neisseria meningitidis]
MLQKIRKALFHPKKFFQDSQWFATPLFSSFAPKSNLFIISTFAQLNQAHSLTKMQKLKNNLLVILYTTQNMKMPKLIQKSVDKELFSVTYMFELPRKPGIVSPKKFLYIQRGYKKLLKTIQPAHLYVMSFAGHYSSLLSLAKKMNITTHLVEEGTATYVPLLESFTYKPTKFEQRFVGNNLHQKGYFDKFDILHVAFPEYAKKIFNANEYHRFFAHSGGISTSQSIAKIQDKYRISQNDYIFVSQRYPVSDEVYYKTIVETLNQMSLRIEGKIFIKLHPKEMENKNIMSLFLNMVTINPRLVVINEPPFLIDPLIYLTTPKGIIGLTSTSIVYTPLLSPTTQCLSIGQIVIDSIHHTAQQENTALIEEHLEIVKQFDFIKILSSIEDGIDTNSFKTEETLEMLLKSAEYAYKNKNFYQAIFYWQLASNNDLSVLGYKSLWYYNALNKVKQNYKMKYLEINYIERISLYFNDKDKMIWQNIKNDFFKYSLCNQ